MKIQYVLLVIALLACIIPLNASDSEAEYKLNNSSIYGSFTLLSPGDSCSFQDSHQYYNDAMVSRATKSDELRLCTPQLIITNANLIHYSTHNDPMAKSIFVTSWIYSVTQSEAVLSYTSDGMTNTIIFLNPTWGFALCDSGDHAMYRRSTGPTVYINDLSQVYTCTIFNNKLLSSNGDRVQCNNQDIGQISVNVNPASKTIFGFGLSTYHLEVNNESFSPRVFFVPKQVSDGDEYVNNSIFGRYSELKRGDQYWFDGQDYYYNGVKLERSIDAMNVENIIKTDLCVILYDQIYYLNSNNFANVSKADSWKIITYNDSNTFQLFFEKNNVTKCVSWDNWQWGFCATDYGEWSQYSWNKSSSIYVNSLDQIYTCSPDSMGWITSNGEKIVRNGMTLPTKVIASSEPIVEGVIAVRIDHQEGSYALEYEDGIFFPRVYIVPYKVYSTSNSLENNQVDSNSYINNSNESNNYGYHWATIGISSIVLLSIIIIRVIVKRT